MANVKAMAMNFMAFLVVLMGFGVVMTSCTGAEDIKETLAAPKTYTEWKTVTVQNYINGFSWFVNNNIYVNGVLGLTYNIDNEKTIIEMPVAQQGMPSLSGNTDTKWNWSDSQVTTTSVETFNNDSLTIWGNITPLYNKFVPTRLHEKVLKLDLVWLVKGGFKLADRPEVNFSREETRTHYQVDPSVRVDTVTNKEIETQIEYVFVEKHDTTVIEKRDTTYIVNNVEVHDTVTVEVIKEVEKEILREVFVQGAEINTNISNNWGFATATMYLGSTHLLTLNIKHNSNPIKVENYGASLKSAATATEWSFDDGQLTNSNSSTNNCSIESITMTKVDKEEIEGVGMLIKTTFHVTGYYTNENGDRKDFAFYMVPMYLQVKEAAPQPNNEEKTLYRGIIRSLSVDGLKLMTKPIRQKWNAETNAWEDDCTFKRVCVGLSGSPSGLDLFVKSRKVIEENEDSHWYVATGDPDKDKQWIGEDSKTDGTVVYRNTKVYDFNYMFSADAVNNGKVGPQTQLYVMRAEKVTVLDPDGNALVCTWENGSEFSLSTSVKLNDTSYVDDPALVGTTRVESDKTYKYETTFTQNFTASIGGKELQNVVSKSPLWVPAE